MSGAARELGAVLMLMECLRLRALVAIAGLAVATACFAQAPRVGRYLIDLRANPQRVPADGKSRARITVEVRNASGGLAQEGTRVIVATDLGWLGRREGERRSSVTVQVRGGAAIVYLVSDKPGVARVVATIEASRAVAKVTFVPPGERAERAPKCVCISGPWVGYCADAAAVEGRGETKVRWGSLLVSVDDLVVLDINTLELRATGATLKKGDVTMPVEDIVADLRGGTAWVRRFTEDGRLAKQQISLYSLHVLAEAADVEEVEIPSFDVQGVEGDIWIIARSVRVFPGQKIVVYKGALYQGLSRVMGLPPYWVIAMPGYRGASNSSMVTMNSEGGLALDFPFFFHVTDTWSGSVKIQRGTNDASVGARRGWSLALQEDYQSERGCTGSFVVAGLPRSDWGIGWRDSRELFGGMQCYTDLTVPDHRSIFFNSSLFSYGRGYRFNLRASFDKPTGYEPSASVTADWLFDVRPLGGSRRVGYVWGITAGLRRGSEFYGTDTRWTFGSELYGALEFMPWNLGGGWQLEPRVDNLFGIYSDGRRSNSVRGELALAGRLGRFQNLQLTYAAEYNSGDAPQTGLRQTASLFSSGFRGRWSNYLNASYDITSGDLLLFASMDYRFADVWRFGVLYTYYDMQAESFSDVELVLARQLFGQEIGLRWSAETGQVSLELVGPVR